MATASRRLAQGYAVDANDAYSAGLLAELGILLFAQADREKYTQLYRQSAHGSGLIDAERQEFGCGHPQLAGQLLARWGMPPDLVAAVEAHHEPAGQQPLLVPLVQSASLLADVLWTPGTPSLAIVRRRLEQSHQLDTDGFLDLCLACQQDLAFESGTFGVALQEPIDCGRLLEQAALQYRDAALEAAMELDSLTAVFTDHSVGQGL
jgi:hypothetical protein